MSQPALKFPKSDRDELFLDIVESLKRLPELHRKVFIRSHYQSQTVAEIARELSLPENIVSDLLADSNQIFYRNLHHFPPARR